MKTHTLFSFEEWAAIEVGVIIIFNVSQN